MREPGDAIPYERGLAAARAQLGDATFDQAWQEGQALPLEAALEIEVENFARASQTTDAAIGIMSFLAKQEPEFTGS